MVGAPVGEPEVRIAATVPVMALSILIASRWSPWVLAVGAVALVTFAKSALDGSQLPSRVLNLIATRGLKTPALREVEFEGRGMAGEFAEISRREAQEEGEVRAKPAASAG